MASAVSKPAPTAVPISSSKYGKCHLSGASTTPSREMKKYDLILRTSEPPGRLSRSGVHLADPLREDLERAPALQPLHVLAGGEDEAQLHPGRRRRARRAAPAPRWSASSAFGVPSRLANPSVNSSERGRVDRRHPPPAAGLLARGAGHDVGDLTADGQVDASPRSPGGSAAPTSARAAAGRPTTATRARSAASNSATRTRLRLSWSFSTLMTLICPARADRPSGPPVLATPPRARRGSAARGPRRRRRCGRAALVRDAPW